MWWLIPAHKVNSRHAGTTEETLVRRVEKEGERERESGRERERRGGGEKYTHTHTQITWEKTLFVLFFISWPGTSYVAQASLIPTSFLGAGIVSLFHWV